MKCDNCSQLEWPFRDNMESGSAATCGPNRLLACRTGRLLDRIGCEQNWPPSWCQRRQHSATQLSVAAAVVALLSGKRADVGEVKTRRVATCLLTLLHNDPLLQHDANLLMRHHSDYHPPVRTPAKGIGQTRRPFRRLCDLFCLCSCRNLLLLLLLSSA